MSEDFNVVLARGITMGYLESAGVSPTIATKIIAELDKRSLIVHRDKVGRELSDAIVCLHAFTLATRSFGFNDERVDKAVKLVVDAALQDKA